MTPRIIAHRGDMECFPENTLAAFSGAKEKGADAIELDVHSSSDGLPIVHHDYTLERTTNGKGTITERPSQYIRQLDAGSWYDKKFDNERVPTIEEVFTLLGQDIRYEIEIRSCEESFLRRLIELVQKHDLAENIEFTSPHAYVLTWLKDKADIRTGMVIATPPVWMPQATAQKIFIANALLGKIDVLHCPTTMLSEPLMRAAKKVNLLIHAADCDTEDQLQQAGHLGVDQLSTSRLSLALNYFKKKPNQ